MLMRLFCLSILDFRQQINVFTPIEEEPDTPAPLALNTVESNRQITPSQSQALVLHKESSHEEVESSAPVLAIEDGSNNKDYLDIDDAKNQLKILVSSISYITALEN